MIFITNVAEDAVSDWQKPLEEFREDVIERLTRSYSEDVLSVDEFERLVEEANTAKTKGELVDLVADLPALRNTALPQRHGSTQYPAQKRKVSSGPPIINIFSGISRKGVWTPSPRMETINVFGGCDLDFRQARIPPEGVHVNAVCVFGGVDIIVPPDFNVEVNGFAIFGGFDNHHHGGETPGAPLIKVTGFAMFGGVDVKVKD